MSTAADGEPRARHGQVVPACIAAMIRRPLDSWVGSVRPAELLCWERKGDLSESARRDLRKAFIKRIRVRADSLWGRQTGVCLAAGWQSALTSADRKRVEALPLSDEKPLESWTIREVKEAMRVPLEHALGILAALEAVYWQPAPPSPGIPRNALVELGPPVKVTPELLQLAESVLALPWLGAVQRHDLRFSYGGDKELPNWLRGEVAKGWVASTVPGLLERLLKANSMTAEEEAHEIATCAARECAPRSGGDESVQRLTSILVRRHISRLGDGRTLAEVGAEFGITRERVRQLCEGLEDLLADAQVATPALDRVLHAAARVAPMQVDEMDEQLRRFIGEAAGLECLVAWAKVLGRAVVPVVCKRVKTRVRGQPVEVTMVVAPDEPPWIEAMVRHVSRDSSMLGCTNVLRVAGRLALKEGLAPGQEAIEGALESAAGFRWLDKETGWFSLGDSSTCAVATRVRKIMAVAQESIGTDEIAGALASDDMWFYRESKSLGLATPPVHVLRELLLGWPWLKVVQRGRFVAGPEFDASGVLSETEQAIVNVITSHNGVACRFEFKEVVLGQMGMTDVLLATILGSSPIAQRLEHGLYALRGRRIADDALAAARIRLRQRTGQAPLDLLANEFCVRVTEASLRNEQYSVPTIFQARLAGKRFAVLSREGEVLGEARVGQAGALAGINRLYPGARPGDQFWVEVTDDALRVRHSRPEDSDRALGEFQEVDFRPSLDPSP